MSFKEELGNAIDGDNLSQILDQKENLNALLNDDEGITLQVIVYDALTSEKSSEENLKTLLTHPNTQISADEKIELLNACLLEVRQAGADRSESVISQEKISTLIDSIAKDKGEISSELAGDVIRDAVYLGFNIEALLKNDNFVEAAKSADPQDILAAKIYPIVDYIEQLDNTDQLNSIHDQLNYVKKVIDLFETGEVNSPVLTLLNEKFDSEQHQLLLLSQDDVAAKIYEEISTEFKDEPEKEFVLGDVSVEEISTQQENAEEQTPQQPAATPKEDEGSSGEAKEEQEEEEEEEEDTRDESLEETLEEVGSHQDQQAEEVSLKTLSEDAQSKLDYLPEVNNAFFNGERSAARLANEFNQIKPGSANSYSDTLVGDFIAKLAREFKNDKIPLSDQTRQDKKDADAFITALFAQSQDTNNQDLISKNSDVKYSAKDLNGQKYCVSLNIGSIGSKLDDSKVDFTKPIIDIAKEECMDEHGIADSTSTSNAALAANVVKAALGYCHAFNGDVKADSGFFSAEKHHIEFCGDVLPDELEYVG